MEKLTVLLVASATLLVVLQFGAETNAAPVPIPNMPIAPPTYVKSPPPPIYSYASPLYPPTYPQPQIPLIPPAAALPSEFEGLYAPETIIGDGNTQFTGFDILSNVNAPVNVLAIDELIA